MWSTLTDERLEKMTSEDRSIWRLEQIYSACEGILDVYASKSIEPNARNDPDIKRALHHIKLAQRDIGRTLQLRGLSYSGFVEPLWCPQMLYRFWGTILDRWADWRYKNYRIFRKLL